MPSLKYGPHFLALFCGLLGTPACTATHEKASKKLTYAAHEFNSGVRWRAHRQASLKLSKALRDQYLDRTETEDKHLRVSEINLLRSKLLSHPKGSKAVLRYQIVWHRINRGIVRKTIVVQYWTQVAGGWQIEALKHSSGEPFPLFEGLKAKPKPRPRPRSARPAAPATPTPRPTKPRPPAAR